MSGGDSFEIEAFPFFMCIPSHIEIASHFKDLEREVKICWILCILAEKIWVFALGSNLFYHENLITWTLPTLTIDHSFSIELLKFLFAPIQFEVSPEKEGLCPKTCHPWGPWGGSFGGTQLLQTTTSLLHWLRRWKKPWWTQSWWLLTVDVFSNWFNILSWFLE